MIDRSATRCVVLSCKFNHGNAGTVCDFSLYGSPCSFTPKVREWQERGGLACFTHLDGGNEHHPDPVEVEANPVEVHPAHSLAWRADQARREGTPMTPERARQLALQMEVER